MTDSGPTALAQGAVPSPEELWNAYYEELHMVAVAVMRGEPRSPSLQPTLVLHEAFLKVFGGDPPEWRGKAYFIASIARQSDRDVFASHLRKIHRRNRRTVSERFVIVPDQLRQD